MSTPTHVVVTDHVRCIGCGCGKCLGASDQSFTVIKPSRREQRRARKAAKNLHMYKTYGRRPWARRDPMSEPHSIVLYNGRGGSMTFKNPSREALMRMAHLHEPSGFKAMSQRAEGMR